MARVCEDWFKKGSYKGQRNDGFYMDETLKQQIEIAAKNVVKDWDFVILITGGGQVRVGKSVLGMQIAAYWSYLMEKLHGVKVPFNIDDNFVYKWQDLIMKGHELSAKSNYCALVYDEAGEALQSTKAMSRDLRAVKDYLRECGQYNFLNILILPDYFDLPKNIAVNRATFLIDVYYETNPHSIFERGYFKFFSWRAKKKLYLYGKKELNYSATAYNFNGRFINFYPIDEDKYRAVKREALKTRGDQKDDNKNMIKNAALYMLNKEYNIPQSKIVDRIKELTGIQYNQMQIRRDMDTIQPMERQKT